MWGMVLLVVIGGNQYDRTDRAEDAVAEVLRFYRRYHSSRFVGESLVLRLNGPLSDDTLAEINAQFADLCQPRRQGISSGPHLARLEPASEGRRNEPGDMCALLHVALQDGRAEPAIAPVCSVRFV